jgi:hypothetical protein
MMIGIKDASINAWETVQYIYNNPRETAEAIGELVYNLWMYYDTRDIKYTYPISIPLGIAIHDKIQKEITRFNEGNILDNSQQLGELVGGGLAAAVATAGVGVILKEILTITKLLKSIKSDKGISADEVNANFPSNYETPYKPGTIVYEFTTTSEVQFVRVHGKNNRERSWIMKKEDIEGLTPEQIKDKYAIPDLPTQITDVYVPAGTRIRVGTAAGNKFGSGGGIQYELLQRLDDSEVWRNTRKIGD